MDLLNIKMDDIQPCLWPFTLEEAPMPLHCQRNWERSMREGAISMEAFMKRVELCLKERVQYLASLQLSCRPQSFQPKLELI